ncbi:MAG: hypothetical protein MUF18_01775 [Fimbriiglobus sp.]|jgi:hypothetical protein|nr:hypothetical protein [Fimbriiglobus sp.]
MIPDRPDPLDAAVRSHLDAEAAKVDAARVLAGIKRRRASRDVSVRRTLHWMSLGAAAIAACLLVGLFLTGQTPLPPKQASAATAAELVQEAKAVHETSVADRCYAVSADWDLKPGMPRIVNARAATVWTRGDQFVVLSAVEDGPPWAWGQQADGRVWLAPNRLHVVVFDKEEVNDPLARFCELMSLRLVSTLGEVLEKYELFRKDSGQPGEPVRIEATLRPAVFPGARFRKVELELDPENKAVRSAVLHRFQNGQLEGKITFTLTDTGTKPDDFYKFEGHTLPKRAVHEGRPQGKPPAGDFRVKFRDELLRKWQKR